MSERPPGQTRIAGRDTADVDHRDGPDDQAHPGSGDHRWPDLVLLDVRMPVLDGVEAADMTLTPLSRRRGGVTAASALRDRSCGPGSGQTVSWICQKSQWWSVLKSAVGMAWAAADRRDSTWLSVAVTAGQVLAPAPFGSPVAAKRVQ